MTDDISMEALSGSLRERGSASRAAGCDIVLHCNCEQPEMQEIVAASGALEGAGAARAEAALAERIAPPEIDIAALDAEFAAQMARAGQAATAPQ
jgi:beta-N-acetylhexosaminidase